LRVWLAVVGLFLADATSVGAQPRILSLDQCADQYVLALRPDATLALSPRADDADSHLRHLAVGHRRIRPTLEAAVAFRPDVVVRTWGGDPRLMRRLEQDGVRTVSIAEATDFDGAARNLRQVAQVLDAEPKADVLLTGMERGLARAGVAEGPRRSATYLTAGGFTAGPGTMIDAMMQAAGLINATTRPGFGPISVERVAWNPPLAFVLGFFDQARADWRGPGRHPVVRRAARDRVVADLPASVLTCPAWFAAEAVGQMAAR